jgi:hypothetical protein
MENKKDLASILKSALKFAPNIGPAKGIRIEVFTQGEQGQKLKVSKFLLHGDTEKICSEEFVADDIDFDMPKGVATLLDAKIEKGETSPTLTIQTSQVPDGDMNYFEKLKIAIAYNSPIKDDRDYSRSARKKFVFEQNDIEFGVQEYSEEWLRATIEKALGYIDAKNVAKKEVEAMGLFKRIRHVKGNYDNAVEIARQVATENLLGEMKH